MITQKMFEIEPELKKEFTEEQLKKTFDTKPKLQRAAIMFAGPSKLYFSYTNLLLYFFFNSRSKINNCYRFC